MAGRDRRRPDHYSERARKEGYPARSIYKLKEIQQKQTILRPGSRILDVGAAPGSWSRYAARIAGPQGRVVAVDLSPLNDLEGVANVDPIVGDICDAALVAALEERGPFDAIISDAAPRTTGNRSVDTARSAALVEQVMGLCPRLLRPGGSLVAKLFQGGDEQTLLGWLRQNFDSARLVKPRASRAESFEVFLVGAGYNSKT